MQGVLAALRGKAGLLCTRQGFLLGAGLVLRALWWVLGMESVRRAHLLKKPQTWVPAHDFLFLDFYANYHSARHWLAGGNPYVEPTGDPAGRVWGYPPAMLWFF